MQHLTLLLAITSLLRLGRAASCSAPTGYANIPGFPAQNKGCYPTTYYQTSDLGQTSPSDAASRCQQQCTSMGSRCGSVVAQVNKAADSNLYPSGTCFFFAPGQTPNGPRQCADTAYLLEGYMKATDDLANCFATSSIAATLFCSSYLGIPQRTSTVTSIPTPITITTHPNITTTVTTTVTSTAPTFLKRGVSVVTRPACATSGAGPTKLSSACSCLSIQTGTTTTTTTATQTTVTVIGSASTVTITATSVAPYVNGTRQQLYRRVQ